MNETKFNEYLKKDYRGKISKRPLSYKQARDMCSRCRRVEDALSTDLETVLDGTNKSFEKLVGSIVLNVKKFGLDQMRHSTFPSIKSAIKRYNEFIIHQST
jgi:excinuclease UvrABC ATPase subunit